MGKFSTYEANASAIENLRGAYFLVGEHWKHRLSAAVVQR